MPTVNGVGISKFTPIKQELFSGMLLLILRVVKGIMRRYKHTDQRFYYIDMNAGPGIYPGISQEYILGSPLIFLKLATQMEIPFKAYFIEKNEANYNLLEHRIKAIKSSCGEMELIYGDNKLVTMQLLRKEPKIKYGLLYSDPSGEVPPFELLADLSNREEYNKIDFAVFLSAANYKRFLHAEHVKDINEILAAKLRAINKSQWIIRRLVGRHQFTFLLGSNWDKFPQWPNKGFYNISSPEGRQIFAQACFTAEEQEDLTLFDLLTLQASPR